MAPVKEAAGPQRRQTFGARRKEKEERSRFRVSGDRREAAFPLKALSEDLALQQLNYTKFKYIKSMYFQKILKILVFIPESECGKDSGGKPGFASRS